MPSSSKCGTVHLVGAGPGDPGLVTLRARELLQTAGVVVYDSLANPSLLDWAPADAEKIDAGKGAGRPSPDQDEILALLVDRARRGKTVVRLKGGDPFVFGRGGEEVAGLEAAGIPHSIVPGVTAALACAAYTGIPLTHRAFSSAVTFVTGHGRADKDAPGVDFRAYGKHPGTLCIYMGVGRLPRIVDELRAGGMPGDTPAAIVEWATLNRQRSVFSTLAKLEAERAAAGIGAPAVVIVGQAVAHRARAEWFAGRPLFGRRILVPRARRQAAGLTRLLESQGAEVIELPFIDVQPHYDPNNVTEVFAGIAVYEWIVFTSANGVRQFFDLFYRAYEDIRCLGPMRVAAVGEATAREIRRHRLKVDLLPEAANGDALADALLEREGLDGVRVLVVTGDRNRDTLPRRLESEGRAIVDALPLYRTAKADIAGHPAAARYREAGADAILFTSSSTVRSFVEQAEALRPAPGARQPAYGSIGPRTSETLRECRLTPAFQSPKADLEHFVVELIAHLDRR